ncbi:uncharacterized protein LOC129746474 [Uranotaenia lowii]|uniref:uncharacterized protein LOC129746474 n=1 Tax=Uranotaenia lowii TaxID=190385 RepID=UPI00247949AA|nr:uncharacterized protein LOC129746474 [Uranotaenia lowii]
MPDFPPQITADGSADYYLDSLVLHDVSVDTVSSRPTISDTDGDGISDNGVSLSDLVGIEVVSDDDGDYLTTSSSKTFPESTFVPDDETTLPTYSALFVSSSNAAPSIPYPSSSLSQSHPSPSPSTGTSSEPAADVEYDQNSYVFEEQPTDRQEDEIFTTNDNGIAYVSTNNDPDLITNNSFDVELTAPRLRSLPATDFPFPTTEQPEQPMEVDDIFLINDQQKLRFVEEEKLPNDDPSALYEHFGEAEAGMDVELISLEDGPISGEEMRKAKSKLFYKNVQRLDELEEQDVEKVEIHTLPSTNEIKTQPPPSSPRPSEPAMVNAIPVTLTPHVPVYLIQEGNGTSQEKTDSGQLPRLLVNISIASDHGSGTVQHSVYVLQVTIPTPAENIPPPKSQTEQATACPPEPPPAPPCPIKCPNSSFFEKYRVLSIIDDESNSTELEEESSDESALLESSTDFTTTTTSSSSSNNFSTTVSEYESPATVTQLPEILPTCPELKPAPILILEGETIHTQRSQSTNEHL